MFMSFFQEHPWMIAAVLIIAVIAVFASGYVKAPPDKAYIISGICKSARGHR